MLNIKDVPGRITVDEMRRYFEKSVNDTACLKANTPLGVVNINENFLHYATPETDTMWLGFALGMRCAERVATWHSAEESK